MNLPVFSGLDVLSLSDLTMVRVFASWYPTWRTGLGMHHGEIGPSWGFESLDSIAFAEL